MEELEAITLLKNGDLRGLEPLVRRYYFQAVRAAYLIVQDHAQAEDIVQTTFMTSCRKINQLTSDRFGPWFLRSVTNASIKAANQQKRLISLNDSDDERSRYLAEWLLDRKPSPETLTETEELRQEIWKAMSRLTPDQRAAVVSKYYLDMSEAEMSYLLRAPLSTIKWRLYTAREKLRQLLAPYKGSPESAKTRSHKLSPKESDEEC